MHDERRAIQPSQAQLAVERKPEPHNPAATVGAGAAIGMLGGLVGLGGAEFRLPLLIGFFRFGALDSIILNKAMSLIVVMFALPFRARAVPFDAVLAHWQIVLNLLAGSLAGAWFGASWATRLQSQLLYRIIAVLLVVIAAVLPFGHHISSDGVMLVSGAVQAVLGVIAGFIIGAIAAFIGVAGGELLIPTLVLLFGVDLKLAGSLSLVVSLPTMLTGFARYSRDRSFSVLRRNRTFVLLMAAGSIVGAFIGGQLLGLVSSAIILPLLTAILLVSAFKVWRHA